MAKSKASPKLDKIKSSVFSRSLSMAKLGLGAGAQLAGRGLTQLWENQDLREARWKDFLTSQAKSFSKEIGELKGSLMKAGQLLSMYGEHFFPPEVNQFLKTLQHDSPPVKWQSIEKILIKELGPEKMVLLEIDHESLASASLGQVHKAKIKKTGEWLALKIQYPGVEKAIESDLRALKALLGMMQILPKDLKTEPLFDEIRMMLHQEVDYQQEADLTESYGKYLKNDPRFVVPKVHREFSNKKVLATSFEEGVRVDDPSVQKLSQERRNHLAESFLDLYFKELFEWGLVQTDPHAGNYRVRLNPDGKDQFVLLDFGATRQYEPKFLDAYKRMVQGSIEDDQKLFHQAARDLHFLDDADDPQLQQLFEEFCFMLVEPFRDEIYDWKNTDLPQRTTKKVMEILKGFRWRTPPKEILFLDRKTGGVFIMMGLLQAKIHGRSLIMKYLSKK